MSEPKKVVVVGGGFGGVKAALELSQDSAFDVSLISAKNIFEYHAALYRSVTGRSKREVAIPLAEIFDGKPVTLIDDVVIKLDPEKKTLVGKSRKTYEYDKLVLALGNVTSYFGIKGLAEFSYGMKSIDEALRLKDHLHDEMMHPEKLDNHYVVVGGGPTGIELAGELISYLNRLYKKHKVTNKTFHVDLVEAAPTILPNLAKAYSARINERLKGLGVNIYTNTAVEGESATSLQLPHGSIETHTVVWTAGVASNPFFAANAQFFNLGKGNRAEVDKELIGAKDIYVIGDSAHTKFSGMAQTALYDGAFVADNMRRSAHGKKPSTYRPGQPVSAIPVGRKWCAVTFKHLRFYGYPGWLVRRGADLHLFSKLLPRKLAWRTWLAGNTIEETCPICAH